MSSVPSEALEDILLSLDRWTLDTVQFTSRRFMLLIMDRMLGVCMRQINKATFRAPNDNTDGGSYTIRMDLLGFREISNAHKDTARLFSEFVTALRNSRVVHLTLERLVVTPALATLVLESPIVAFRLDIFGGSCAELTPTQLQRILLHLSPSSLWLGSDLRAGQVSDELVRALKKSGVRRATFTNRAPMDGSRFCVTDDAIIDFCAQPDVQISQEGYAQFKELHLYNGSFTKNLFKRLVEASALSTHTQRLQICVSPIRFKDEDLRDFAQHLSYRNRGETFQQRIYDFPGELHGAAGAMHLQIVLSQENDGLEMIRALRPDTLFYEPDE
ncbi:hypothetical protein AAVH_24584 [Aphelenchoides avenae]|nr:hypothetical protein AAVH_24584 [Aphelenchus avenae]